MGKERIMGDALYYDNLMKAIKLKKLESIEELLLDGHGGKLVPTKWLAIGKAAVENGIDSEILNDALRNVLENKKNNNITQDQKKESLFKIMADSLERFNNNSNITSETQNTIPTSYGQQGSRVAKQRAEALERAKAEQRAANAQKEAAERGAARVREAAKLGVDKRNARDQQLVAERGVAARLTNAERRAKAKQLAEDAERRDKARRDAAELAAADIRIAAGLAVAARHAEAAWRRATAWHTTQNEIGMSRGSSTISNTPELTNESLLEDIEKLTNTAIIRPEEFICPITRAIMTEPARPENELKQVACIEKSALQRCCGNGNGLHPLTRNQIGVIEIDTNLQEKIATWIMEEAVNKLSEDVKGKLSPDSSRRIEELKKLAPKDKPAFHL